MRRVASFVTLSLLIGLASVSAYLSPTFMTTIDVTAPQPSSLRIYLPLAGDYLDQSGNNNHGTPAGSPVFGSASWGTALNCDNVDDRVTIASDPSFANATAYSFAACVNARTGGEQGNGRVYDWDDASSGDAGLLAFRNAILAFQGHDERYATQRGAWHTGNSSVTTNTTYHVIFTYDHNTLTPGFYINGSFVTPVLNDAPTGAFNPATGPLHVCNTLAQDQTFDGFVGHFRMYNEVIDAGLAATIAQDCTPPMAGQCPGDTCYVRAGGSDANDCSDATVNACATVQRAVDRAQCGDTVDVGPSVFANQRTVVAQTCTSGNELTIRGAGIASTTVDGDTDISITGTEWSLAPLGTYPDGNVYQATFGLGRIAQMRNAATGETFRLISNSCMDGVRDDCWGGSGQDGDWLLNQDANALFTQRQAPVNAWNASRIRYGTKSSNVTYFREKDGLNPNTLDLRACADVGTAANVFTITGNYVILRDMTIIGCRRSVYISGNNNVVQDIIARNHKQGVMVEGGQNTVIRRVESLNPMPWVTYGGEPPQCGWSNEPASTPVEFRSACALHRHDAKDITGESTVRHAGFWITGGADGTIVEESDGYHQATVLYISGSANVTVRNNYFRYCSSACITLANSTINNLQVYDNRFWRFNNWGQTLSITVAGGSWYFYNNRGNTTEPYGNGFEFRVSGTNPNPTQTMYFYHNSFSQPFGIWFVSSNIDSIPNGYGINNISDGDWPYGTARSSAFTSGIGYQCYNHNWNRGNDVPINPWAPVPQNIDAGAKAWTSEEQLYSDSKWATIPAAAQNSGIDAFSGTWTCRSGVTGLPALPWNSASPQPGATPNMGWQQP